MNDPNKYGTWQEGIFAWYKPKYICDNCEKYPCSADETKLMLSCPAYSPKPKPITNYDRIISKTPEELAEYLFIKTCEDGFPQFTTKNDWLDWLKQEAE